jgi:quercetin dioxygenase-like cupin family protein
VRLKFPANYAIPAHSHPTTENVTVTSGALFVGMGDKLNAVAGKALGVGGVASLPANMNHYAYTKAETTVVLFGQGPVEFKYVNAADDPRSKK